MTLEQIAEIETFLKSKGLSDDAIDGAVKSISFHEDTARIKDSEDAKRGLDIINFKPNPGKATLTQVGETQTYLGGDNRGLPIYKEDVDMIKKALPLAKRLIELQKTKSLESVEEKPFSEMTAQERVDYLDAEDEKEKETLRTLRNTIDEVYEIDPDELNIGPDTTENIHEIGDNYPGAGDWKEWRDEHADVLGQMSKEDRMNLEAGWHKLPEKVKLSMLRSQGIKKNENTAHDGENKKAFEPREQYEEKLSNVSQEMVDPGFWEAFYWKWKKNTPEAAIDDKAMDENKMKESFKKTQKANIYMGTSRDKEYEDDYLTKGITPLDYYKYSSIIKRMDDTHTRKNNDYGDAAYRGYKKYGDYYFLVQLHNKLSRLESLTVENKKLLVKDESIDDTLLDMANYAVMYLESRHRND